MGLLRQNASDEAPEMHCMQVLLNIDVPDLDAAVSFYGTRWLCGRADVYSACLLQLVGAGYDAAG